LAIIPHGACVGVFYRDATNSGAECGNGYCVHNGRLVGGIVNETSNTITVKKDIDMNKLHSYKGILLSHLALSTNPSQVIQQYLNISSNRLITVKVTPFSKFNVPKCSLNPHYTIPNIIYPGECIGIQYLDVTGTWQIRNGRYLYWKDQKTNHCIFDERPNSIDRNSLRELFYSHYVLNNPTKPTDIIAQPMSRGRGTGRGESRVFVYKLMVPLNKELIPVKPVVSPPGSFTKKTIIYQ